MKRTVSIGATLLLCALIANGPASPADAAYSCANRAHDGVGADGASETTNTNVNGVAGTIYVPPFTSANLYGQATTDGNVSMIIQDSVAHFFQIGWYVGSSPGLPTASTPKVFAGEGLISTQQETLTYIDVPVAGGSWHSFKMQQDENPLSPTFRRYFGFVDGVKLWASTMSTAIEGTPRMLGETNWDCADMYAQASTPSGGATLQGHHAGGGWSTWQQHIGVTFGEPMTTPSCWFNGRVNGLTATVFAYDQC